MNNPLFDVIISPHVQRNVYALAPQLQECYGWRPGPVEVPAVARAVRALVAPRQRRAVLRALQQRVVDANVSRVAVEAAHAPVHSAVALCVAAVDAPAPRARAAQALLDDGRSDQARRVEGAQIHSLAAGAIRVGDALEARAGGVERKIAGFAHAVLGAVRVRRGAAVQSARMRQAAVAKRVGRTPRALPAVLAGERGVAAASHARGAASRA